MEKQTPTDYLRQDRTDADYTSTPTTPSTTNTFAPIRRGVVDQFATTITDSDRSSDNAEFEQFPKDRNYLQHTVSTTVEKRSEKDEQVGQLVVVSPSLTEPPPYTPSCPSNSSDSSSPDFGNFVTAPFPLLIEQQPQRQYYDFQPPTSNFKLEGHFSPVCQIGRRSWELCCRGG
jgi:hypothetical protein